MNRFLLLGLASALFNPLVSALKIASSLTTIEYTPESIANKDYYNNSATIVNGGVPSLFSDTSVDLASNAETQALRGFATHKNLRAIYTVAEVYYRIVANKKSGIAKAEDLKGKKIATFQGTSAAYFVYKYMESVGLKESDYTIVSGQACSAAPCGAGTFPYMLTHGTADAVGMWEPSVELALEALGDDGISFQNRTVYREVFNLHTTAEKLKDPAKRKDIVAFLKVLTQAEKVFDTDPDQVYSRVASLVNVNATVLKAVWPIHSWKGTLAPDLLNVMVEEDQWLAKVDRRTAMSRTELADMIDDSVLKEALSGSP